MDSSVDIGLNRIYTAWCSHGGTCSVCKGEACANFYKQYDTNRTYEEFNVACTRCAYMTHKHCTLKDITIRPDIWCESFKHDPKKINTKLRLEKTSSVHAIINEYDAYLQKKNFSKPSTRSCKAHARRLMSLYSLYDLENTQAEKIVKNLSTGKPLNENAIKVYVYYTKTFKEFLEAKTMQRVLN